MEDKRQKVQATFKSRDTEEHIDIYFTRPLGYLWARFFEKLNVHPNVVTVLSMILGVAAAVMFCFPDLLHNLLGVLLLVWANLYDSADGQLARMTGKKTHWGRMLDGFAGDVWFVALYLAIIFRLYNEPIPFTNHPWGLWGFVLCFVGGVLCHGRQSRLADYYRNIHLFFLPGAQSELDSSAQQRLILEQTPKKGNFWWRAFLASYVRYTAAQEKMTPEFQKLMEFIRSSCGGRPTKRQRREFRRQSLPLMKYTNILTFNWRAITLYASCLLNIPWAYPLVEIVVFSIIYLYMHSRHEQMCRILLLIFRIPKYPQFPTA